MLFQTFNGISIKGEAVQNYRFPDLGDPASFAIHPHHYYMIPDFFYLSEFHLMDWPSRPSVEQFCSPFTEPVSDRPVPVGLRRMRPCWWHSGRVAAVAE